MSNLLNPTIVATLANQYPVEVGFIAKQILGGLDDLKIKAAICRDTLRSEITRERWDSFFAKAADLVPPTPKPTLPAPPVSPPKPLGVPDASVRMNNPSSPVSPQVANAAMRSSQAVQKQRLAAETAGNSSTLNQILGTTPENMQRGQQAANSEYQRLINTAGPEHNLNDPKTLAVFRARANTFNPMHPSNDLMSSSDAAYAQANPWNLPRNLYAARRGIGEMGKAVPRAVAGFRSFIPAATTDAMRAVTGQGTDWQLTQGAVYDTTSPLFNGIGVDPLGNNGVKSLYNEIMPQYAKALENAASQEGQPAWRRAMLNAEASLASNAKTIAIGLGASQAFRNPGFSGPLATALRPLGTAAKAVGPGNALLQAGFSVAPEFKPNATGSGSVADDIAASTRQQHQYDLANHAAYQQSGGIEGAPIPRGADGPGANLAMQSRYVRQGAKNDTAASNFSKMLDANSPKPPTSPEEAIQRSQAATQSIQSLPQMVQAGKISPDAAVPAFKSNLRELAVSHAFQTGAAPGAHIATAAKLLDPDALKKNPSLMSQLMQTPGAQELSKEVSTPGSPPFLEGVMSAFGKMEGWQRAAIYAGIPLAAIGIGQTLFGNGGMGSIIMSLLGVGMAGFGAFGGGGNVSTIPGMSSLQSYMRGGQPAAPQQEPPATPAPSASVSQEASPVVPTAAPAAPAASAVAQAASATPKVDWIGRLDSMAGDGKITPQEFAQIPRSARETLLQAPAAKQQQYVRALRAGDSRFGPMLDMAHGAMKTKGLGWLDQSQRVYDEAAKKGISPRMLDAILAADR